MAVELARSLGVAVRFVDSSFATLVDDVRADRCDIAMFAIAITRERAEKLRFASPHPQSDIHAITTGSTAGCATGPTSIAPAWWWRWPAAPTTSR